MIYNRRSLRLSLCACDSLSPNTEYPFVRAFLIFRRHAHAHDIQLMIMGCSARVYTIASSSDLVGVGQANTTSS